MMKKQTTRTHIHGISAVFAEVSKLSQNFKKRKDAQLILDWVAFNTLSPNHKMRFKYLEGQIHFLNYRSTNSVFELEAASQCFDEIFNIAHQHGQSVSIPQYFYYRIYTKHLISILTPIKSNRERLAREVLQLVQSATRGFKNNPSIQWIASKVNPTGHNTPLLNLNAYWQ